MSNIETIARAVLDGAARGDEAKVLARWVLERCDTEQAPACTSCDGFGRKPSGEWCIACQGYEVGAS